MNLKNKQQLSKLQAQEKEAKNASTINPENLSQYQDKANLAANSLNILNSKDIEVFNNMANKLTNDTATAGSSLQKKKKVLNKNASYENIKNLVENKNKEMEIYNKINNFSLKYSNGQSQNSNLYSTRLLSQRSAMKKGQADSFITNNSSISKSNSKNATPNKKKNLLTNLDSHVSNKNNNLNFNFNSNNNNNINNNNNYSINNSSNASLNNTLLLQGQKNTTNNFNTNFNLKNKNANNNIENQSKISNNSNSSAVTVNKIRDVSALKQIKSSNDSAQQHKSSIISPEEDFENCVVSDEEDHLPQAPHSFADQQLNRSIVLKPKPVMEQNNYLSRGLFSKAVIEEESESNTVIEGDFQSAAYTPQVVNNKSPFYESKNNLMKWDFDKENNACDVNANLNANAERNNKELLQALTHMEQEMNKSEFNNGINSKSILSNNGISSYYI